MKYRYDTYHHNSLNFRHNTEPHVRLRYSSQGTESNLVSMQRSSSLPVSSHINPSSLQPSSLSTHPSSRASAPLEFPPQIDTSPNISQEYPEEHAPLETPGGKNAFPLNNSIST